MSYIKMQQNKTKAAPADPTVQTENIVVPDAPSLVASIDPQEPIAVSGANGYVASHIIYQLLDLGYCQIRGSVRNPDAACNEFLHTFHPRAKECVKLYKCDLLNASGWAEFVKDVKYVIHVASPFSAIPPEDEQETIRPAVDGVRHVFQACIEGKKVKRIVLTSSIIAAAELGPAADGTTINEECWSLPSVQAPYGKSKTLAEKEAWEFFNSQAAKDLNLEMVAINPGLVMGPVFAKTQAEKSTSTTMLKLILLKEYPGVIRYSIPLVDVRDVATAHIRALFYSKEKVNGKRFICVDKTLSMAEQSQILLNEFGSSGFHPSTWEFPDFIVKFMALFSPRVKQFVKFLGKRINCDNTRIREDLLIRFRDVSTTLVDHVLSLIQVGDVGKRKVDPSRIANFKSYTEKFCG